MINKIENWSYDKPTEAGDYLCCYGDVETPKNVEFIRVVENTGELFDEATGWLIHEYSSSYKFARLIYAPSELEGLE